MKLQLIRGLPGSGTSTLAKEVYLPKGYVHFESEMFFMENGRFAYDPKKNSEARKWCRDQVYEALCAGRDVVVSDWFIRKESVEPYRVLAKTFKADLNILTIKTQFESKRVKNKAKFEQIKSRWEEVV